MAIIKRFAVWAFRLDELKDLIKEERKKQRVADEREWRHRLEACESSYEKQLKYMKLAHEIELEDLGRQIKAFQKREKNLIEREYATKAQFKRNVTTASELYTYIFQTAEVLQKGAGEVQGVIDRAKRNKEFGELDYNQGHDMQ